MASNHAIKFFTIAKLFHDDEKQLRRGENAHTSGHVKSVNFNSEVKPAIIKGSVQASMKKRLYNISIDLKKQSIISTFCTCPREQVTCHHLAALLFYCHYNISSTDIQQQWGTKAAPLGECEEDVKTIEELYTSKQQYTAVNGEISETKISSFTAALGQTNVVGFSWLLKPEADMVIHKLVPSIETILFSEEYLKAENQEEHFQNKCYLSNDDIKEIAALTVGQHSNESWLITRKCRLTASKFGLVLNFKFYNFLLG